MAGLNKTSVTFNGGLDTIRFAVAYAHVVLAFKALFDPYRPERHYMRGPGPKWHAKHSAAC